MCLALVKMNASLFKMNKSSIHFYVLIELTLSYFEQVFFSHSCVFKTEASYFSESEWHSQVVILERVIRCNFMLNKS